MGLVWDLAKEGGDAWLVLADFAEEQGWPYLSAACQAIVEGDYHHNVNFAVSDLFEATWDNGRGRPEPWHVHPEEGRLTGMPWKRLAARATRRALEYLRGQERPPARASWKALQAAEKAFDEWIRGVHPRPAIKAARTRAEHAAMAASNAAHQEFRETPSATQKAEKWLRWGEFAAARAAHFLADMIKYGGNVTPKDFLSGVAETFYHPTSGTPLPPELEKLFPAAIKAFLQEREQQLKDLCELGDWETV